jgi:hypothetical protein
MFATGQERTAGCGHHYTAGRVHHGDATWSATPAGRCWPALRDDRSHLKNDAVAVGIHQLVHDVVQLLGS